MADVELVISADTKKALDSIQSFTGSAANSLKIFAAAAAAYIGSKAIINSIDSFVSAASESEDAINNLNVSLASAGTYSDKASQAFQDFATEMQRTTGISDELILNQAAIARNFSKTNEAALKLTEAAIQLSAATGKDLGSSIDMLGKSLEGIGTGLGKAIPATKGFTEEQLKAGMAIDFVLSRFSGVAESKLLSFSGAITKAKNSFDDMLEVIGDVIIKNPILIELINLTAIAMHEFTKFIEENKDSLKDFITSGLKAIVSIVPQVVKVFGYIIDKIGLLIFIIAKATEYISLFVNRLLKLKPIEQIVNAIADVFIIFGLAINSTIYSLYSLLDIIPGMNDVFKRLGMNLTAAKDSLLSLQGKLQSKLFTNSTEVIAEGFDSISNYAEQASITISNGMTSAGNVINKIATFTQNASDKIQKMGSTQSDASKKAIDALNAQGNAVSNLELKLAELGTKLQEIYKKPFDFLVKITFEALEKNASFSEMITGIKKFFVNNEFQVKIGTAALSALTTIFKSGFQLSSVIEKEFQTAIDAINYNFNQDLLTASKKHDDTVKKINDTYMTGVDELNNALKDGGISEQEYATKLQKLNSDKLKATQDAEQTLLDDRYAAEKKFTEDKYKADVENEKKIQAMREKNIESAGQMAGSVFDSILKIFKIDIPIFSDLFKILSMAPAQIKETFVTLAKSMPDLMERLAESLPELIASLIELAPDIVERSLDRFPTIIEKLIGSIGRALERIISSALGKYNQVALDVMTKTINELGKGLSKIFSEIGNFLEPIFQKIGDAIFNAFQALIDGVTKVWTEILNGLNAVITFFKDVINNIVTALSAILENLKSLGNSIVQAAKDFAANIFDSAKNFVNNIISGASRIVQTIVDALFNALKDLGKSIGGGSSSAIGGNGKGSFENAIGIDIPGSRFAKGGIIPQGYPHDNFPASLTSGEMVIPRDDVAKLSSFLDNQNNQDNNSSQDLINQIKQVIGNSTAGKIINVTLQVGEKELASVMLDLNRRGFRTS